MGLGQACVLPGGFGRVHEKHTVESQLGGATWVVRKAELEPLSPGHGGTPQVSKQQMTSGKSDLAVVSSAG